MPTLTYTARTLTGELREGKIRAANEHEARNSLSSQGLEPIELATIAQPGKESTRRSASSGGFFKPFSLATLANFTAQLALMLRTGTALLEGLDALAKQAHSDRARKLIEDIRNRVSGGATLTDAMAAHPTVFEPFYVSSVRAGEASGKLVEVFKRIEGYLHQRLEIRTKVTTALIYPGIITTLAIAAVAFILTFVLPRFIAVFERSGVALPLPTRILMAFSYSAVTYWYLWIGGIAASIVAIYLFVKTPTGRNAIDFLMLRLPVLGPLTNSLQTAALMRSLGTLLDAGVPLVQGLEVARDSCGNGAFRRLTEELIARVVSGGDMASVIRHNPLISPSIQQMVITGEKSGALAEVMIAIANHLDDDADKQIKRLMALFEPVVLIGMGVMVGFIAVSVLLPLFRLTSAARGAG